MASVATVRSAVEPRQRPWLGPLAAWHLAFLAADALYIATGYPAAGAAVLFILATATASEVLPSGARRFLIEELLLVVGAGASFLLCVDIPEAGPAASESFAGWARMVFAYWLLIPARPGLLRWQLSLAIAELLILGRKPGGLGPALALAPIGVGCLAIDAWLRGTAVGRVRGKARRSRWSVLRWTVVPCAAVIALGMALGATAYRNAPRATAFASVRGAGEHGASGMDTRMHIGDHTWVDKDPRILARMLWEDRPLVEGAVYLRALALPHLVLEDGAVTWVTDGARHPVPPAKLSDRWAWVVRYPDGRDSVLAPDGGAGAELEDQRGDRHGNRFRDGLGQQIAVYRVDIGGDGLVEDEVDVHDYLRLPGELQRMPWATIEDPHWKEMPAMTAAARISAFLQGHCVYDTDNLPKPHRGAAGTLDAFLFGQVEERRGHCQYFATAAAVLLRRAGHPTRCVAGLASAERDDQGYIFRGFHAHAWVEVLDEEGVWRRVDATPSSRLDHLPTEGADGSGLPPPDALPRDLHDLARETNAPARSWRWLAVGLTVLAALGLAARGLFAGRGLGPRDPRLKALSRHTGDLFRFAESIGIRIAPSSTLTAVVEQVETRTGVRLARDLRAHLDARYGGGPMPQPWPLERLREAIELKRGAVRA